MLHDRSTRPDSPVGAPPAPALRAGLRWLFCLVAAAPLLSAGGCGGCGCGRGSEYAAWGGMSREEWLKRREEKKKAEEADELEAKEKAEEELERRAAEKASAAKVNRNPNVGRWASNASEELPPLPLLSSDFAEWTESDYQYARRVGEAALVPAVEHLAAWVEGDESTARLLAALLEQAPTARSSVPRVRARRSSIARLDANRLIEVIVDALARSGTAAGRETLRQLLSGDVATDNDAAAVPAAMTAMARHAGAGNDETLLDVLTSQRDLRTGPGAIRSRSPQAVALLKPVASRELRLRAAERMLDPATPADARDALSTLIADDHPENLEAQILLVASERIDAVLRRSLETRLAEYGSHTLSALLGLDDSRPGGASRNDDWNRRVARGLWGDPFTAALERRLGQIESLKEGAGSIVLAGTIPRIRVQGHLAAALQRHWEEGPASLKAAGFPAKFVVAPHLLLAAKIVHREAIDPAAPGRSYRAAGLASPDRRRQVQRVRSTQQEELDSLRKAWLEVYQELHQRLCDGLSRVAAAEGGHLDALRAWERAQWADSPFQLHSGANPVSFYRCDWPGNPSERFPGISLEPLRIRHVRAEQRARPSAAIGYFRRRLPSCEERVLDRALWFDDWKPGSEPGSIRSIDVRIAAAGRRPTSLPDEEQDLVIDVLLIEAGDPRVE